MAEIFQTGVPITIVWTLTKPDGTAFSLEGYQYQLFYCVGNRYREAAGSTVSGNVISWVFPSELQSAVGDYSLRLKLFQNGYLFNTIDYNRAFTMMRGDSSTNNLSQQEQSSDVVSLFTVAEFYLLSPVIPTIGSDKYWYVNGTIVTDSNGEYLSAEHTLRYDETTKYLIIDEGRVDAHGESIQQTITDVAAALADWESRYAAAEGTADSTAGDGSRWGSYKSAETSRDASYQVSEGTPTSTTDDGSRWGNYKAAEASREASYGTEEGSMSDSTAGDGSRWGSYKAAEESREESYGTEEGSVSSTAGDGSRWGSYKTAEADRNAESALAEGTSGSTAGDGSRWGAYKSAETDRQSSYGDAETNRNSAYLTAEGNSTSVAGDGSRWGTYKTAEAARDAISSEDHTQAEADHTRAGEDHSQAAADHTQAVSDHATWADKADKDTDAVAGNLAKFDSSGNPVDSGIAYDDVLVDTDIVDNLTTDDATKALSAKQGKVLDGKVSQLGQNATELDNLRFEQPEKQNVLYELGDITISNSGWSYSASTSRVRSPENFILHLYPGDIIGLTDYTNARFYWGLRDMSGKYTSGGWKTEDVVVAKEGYLCMLVCNLTDTVQTSAEALGSLINVRRKTNLGSVISTLADISVGTISLYSSGHFVNDYGGDSSNANFNIYKAVVKKGDYICVTGNNSATIGVLSRASNLVANRVDAFMLGNGSQVPVRYICENDEDIFISTAVNASFEIVHIKDRQRETLIDAERINFEDITAITAKVQGYIKYSDGSFNTTSSQIYVRSFKTSGVSKVRVYVSNGDTTAAAIAFYSSETMGTASFISAIQIGRNNGGGRWFEASVPNTAVLCAVTNHNTYCPNPIVKVDAMAKMVVDKATEESGVDIVKKLDAFAGQNPFRFGGQFFAHLFLDKIYQDSTNIVIPSESLHDVRVSARLGYKAIEANVQTTSDGAFIVIHGSGGKFGYEVTDLNGAFTYADTAINSKTLEWIKENIRYRSDVPRYRTAIPTLKEFLVECRLNGMIPFCQASTAQMVALLDGIMGYGNYIAYNGTRALTNAPICEYKSLATKEEILASARDKGVPYIYSMANIASFTDSELEEIVQSLHAEGFMIATAYTNPTSTNRAIRSGFDIIAAGYQVNDFDANYGLFTADADWDDFTTTGTITNDGVSMTSGKTITPANAPSPVFLSKGLIRVTFTGELVLNFAGVTQTITSDGTQSMMFSSYFINDTPTFQLSGTSNGATITDLVFKVSKC